MIGSCFIVTDPWRSWCRERRACHQDKLIADRQLGTYECGRVAFSPQIAQTLR